MIVVSNKKIIILLIISILIVIASTVGITFAYLSISATQTTANTFETSCFKVTFADSNTISLNTAGKYVYPMSESTALSKLTPYTFTITNGCTSANSAGSVNYVITLSSLTGTTSNLKPYLKYKLNKTNSPTLTGTATSLTTTTYTLPTQTISTYGIDTTYQLGTGTLAAGASATYNLYLWIDESAGNSVMDYSFTGKLIVYVDM